MDLTASIAKLYDVRSVPSYERRNPTSTHVLNTYSGRCAYMRLAALRSYKNRLEVRANRFEKGTLCA